MSPPRCHICSLLLAFFNKFILFYVLFFVFIIVITFTVILYIFLIILHTWRTILLYFPPAHWESHESWPWSEIFDGDCNMVVKQPRTTTRTLYINNPQKVHHFFVTSKAENHFWTCELFFFEYKYKKISKICLWD